MREIILYAKKFATEPSEPYIFLMGSAIAYRWRADRGGSLLPYCDFGYAELFCGLCTRGIKSGIKAEGFSMHRIIAFAIVALAAVIIYSARAEVLIGVAGPMTGKLAWIGEQVQRGAEMAVADINAAGGVLGQQVRLITVDDFCDPEQAVAAAQKLVADGVVLVVGHYCSGASIPASKVYEAAGVLQISPGSTNPLLTEQGRANVFRVIGRDDAQGIVAGNYLADHWGDKKIAILHDGTTYGKGLADETKKQLNKRGVTEAIYEAYDSCEGTTMRPKSPRYRRRISPWCMSAGIIPRPR